MEKFDRPNGNAFLPNNLLNVQRNAFGLMGMYLRCGEKCFRVIGVLLYQINLLDVKRNVFWIIGISFRCLWIFLDDRNVFKMLREMFWGDGNASLANNLLTFRCFGKCVLYV